MRADDEYRRDTGLLHSRVLSTVGVPPCKATARLRAERTPLRRIVSGGQEERP